MINIENASEYYRFRTELKKKSGMPEQFLGDNEIKKMKTQSTHNILPC
jgi:hypothetical protein